MSYKKTIPIHEVILKKTKTSKLCIKKYNFYLDDENIPIQDALQKVDEYSVSSSTKTRIRRYLEKIYEIYNITPNDEAIITPEKQQEILKKYETTETPTIPEQETKTEEQEEIEQHDIKKTYEKIKELNENIKQLKREQKKQEQEKEYHEFLQKYENITTA